MKTFGFDLYLSGVFNHSLSQQSSHNEYEHHCSSCRRFSADGNRLSLVSPQNIWQHMDAGRRFDGRKNQNREYAAHFWSVVPVQCK